MVENRQYDNTYDQSLPGAVVGLSGGILIWNILNDGLNLGETDLIEADGVSFEQQTNMAHDLFRPSVYTTGMISDMTSPANLNLRNGSKSKFAISNYSSTGNPLTVDLLINYDPAPEAPADLEISNAGQNGQNPQLSWDANSEFDLDHYAIFQGFQTSGTGPISWNSNPAGTTSNTSWTDQSFKIDTGAGSDVVHYRITAIDDADNESDYSNSVSTGVEGEVPGFKRTPESTDELSTLLPKEIALHQNYPNPFNPETQIQFELPQAATVSLVIYNLLGEQVRTLVEGSTEAGFHPVRWQGKDDQGRSLPSGVYVYRLQVLGESGGSPVFVQSNKLTLLK